MSGNEIFRKGLIMAMLVFSTVLVTWSLSELHFFSRMELASFDHRVSIFRSDKPIHEDVVLVLIDDESLQQMSSELGRWPWPRSAYKDILEFFTIANAQALAFDILFTEKDVSGLDNQNDLDLIEATQKSGIAVHAMQLLHSPDSKDIDTIPNDFISHHQVENIDFEGIDYNDALLPIDGLYQAARNVGYLEIEPDRDGVYRRIRLFNRYKEQAVFPAFASVLVMPVISDGSYLLYDKEHAIIGDTEIPLDGSGQYLINPYGELNIVPVHQVFSTMKKIRAGKKEQLILNPQDFENKIIFLAGSAIGLLDVKATAMSSKEAGVFLHANTVSNILEQDFLIKVEPFYTYLLIIIFSTIVVVPTLIFSRLLFASLIPVLIGTAYIVVAYFSFTVNYLFSIMPVLFALAFSLLLAFSYRSYIEKYSKQKIRAMLSQYVSPAVLTHVVDNYETLNAEIGSNESLSILFSDIRGFTNISETQEANKVVDMLNIYFSEMTDIIFEHRGTLDKFIGDAIMAFWGAPIKATDHADQAVHAAISMREKLPLVNEKLVSKSYTPIDVGIGIHTGKVILGNIGSAKKLDYTVIGDSVNLASRIEGITKKYAVPIIISEDTFNALSDKIPCIVVDVVRLKGKQHPVKLYAPARIFLTENRISISPDEFVNLSNKAFEYYQNSRWGEAIEIYKQFVDIKLFKILLDRCTYFVNNKPGDWDGIYDHTSK